MPGGKRELIHVVIDTNVLVSAMISRSGKPAEIIQHMINKTIIPCYDHRILREYIEVLNRPRFGFTQSEIQEILILIRYDGLSVVPAPFDITFTDEPDKAFYETALFCRANLITGNKKHYPQDSFIVTPAEFLEKFVNYL